MNRRDPLRYSLRQLEVFLAVARAQTTASAAVELAMSQSAVSAALKTLEGNYDVALFDRVGKRLVLNAVGQHIRTHAEALLTHAREVDFALAGQEHIGDLNIGASFTIANHVAIDYLAQWLQEFPDARVDIATGNSPEIVAKVLNHEVDLGLIEEEIKHADLELTPWLEDELIVFAAPHHPLSEKRSLTEADLLSARWILREKDSGARQRFDQTFASLLADMQIFLEFRHNEPIRRAVEQGLGIGCLSEKVLQQQFDSGQLTPLRLPKAFRLRRRFFICQRRKRFNRAAVEAFVDLCTAATSP